MKYLLPAGLFCLFLFSCQKEGNLPAELAAPSAADELLIETLGKWAHPISGYAPALPTADLAPIDALGQVPVLGLGEATHGSKPFFAMKHRLFQYLVENHGFRGLAFEMDFAESLLFDRYISDGTENLRELMKEKMLFWTWRTEEVMELLEWMRHYNATRPASAHLHIYGIDCQLDDYQAEFLLQRIDKVDEGLSERIKRKLAPYQNRDYSGMALEEAQPLHDSIRTAIEDAIISIQKFQPLLEEASSPYEYRLTEQLAKSILQTEDYTFLEQFSQAGDLRERYMAENTIWMGRQLEGKIAVWAHNNHVGKTTYYAQGSAMGHHLREQLGESYQVIGFTFGKGNFQAVGSQSRSLGVQAITKDPPLNSINGLFYQFEERNFMVFLKGLQQDEHWAAWLQQPRPMLNIGSVYHSTSEGRDNYFDRRIANDFDVLIHFDISSPTELIR